MTFFMIYIFLMDRKRDVFVQMDGFCQRGKNRFEKMMQWDQEKNLRDWYEKDGLDPHCVSPSSDSKQPFHRVCNQAVAKLMYWMKEKNAINSTLQPMNDNIHGRTLTRTYLVRKAINIYQSFLSHYFSGLPCLLFYMGASQIPYFCN